MTRSVKWSIALFVTGTIVYCGVIATGVLHVSSALWLLPLVAAPLGACIWLSTCATPDRPTMHRHSAHRCPSCGAEARRSRLGRCEQCGEFLEATQRVMARSIEVRAAHEHARQARKRTA